jgi:hypothetical protein
MLRIALSTSVPALRLHRTETDFHWELRTVAPTAMQIQSGADASDLRLLHVVSANVLDAGPDLAPVPALRWAARSILPVNIRTSLQFAHSREEFSHRDRRRSPRQGLLPVFLAKIGSRRQFRRSSGQSLFCRALLLRAWGTYGTLTRHPLVNSRLCRRRGRSDCKTGARNRS